MKTSKILLHILSLSLLFLFLPIFLSAQEKGSHKYGLIIHGGAGNITPITVPAEDAAEYRAKLMEALHEGYAVLRKGGSSLDAVEKAIKIMEDSPLFNAGKGAVFNHEGINELDASIMDGKTLNAGAVAEVRHIKNPIVLARLVMVKSPHVMLAGKGAEEFAVNNGVKLIDTSYFFIQKRWEDLQKALEKEKAESGQKTGMNYTPSDSKFGTVGVAAIDKDGNLAAGTSTGGMTNKQYGRIGDSPIIGAGTYADNNTCAVSCTGHGEYFIRIGVAKEISDRMEFKNETLQQAVDEVINGKLEKLGGTGGVIAMDKDCNPVWQFNTPGMFRGYYIQGSEPVIELYGKKN